jgi:hypothetical protein
MLNSGASKKLLPRSIKENERIILFEDRHGYRCYKAHAEFFRLEIQRLNVHKNRKIVHANAQLFEKNTLAVLAPSGRVLTQPKELQRELPPRNSESRAAFFEAKVGSSPGETIAANSANETSRKRFILT